MTGKTLLIAVDNSKACLKAIDFALDHFPKGYTYHLVHVQGRPVIFLQDAALAAYAYETEIEKKMTSASESFMKGIFIPTAASAGAQVVAHVLHAEGDSASSVGNAICKYAEDTKPAALLLMRENKSAVNRFFMGSVTKYCATHCLAPVIIVPASEESPKVPAAAGPKVPAAEPKVSVTEERAA